MNSEIKIKNSAEVCHIDIEGTIGVPEEWQFEEADQRVATYEKFRDTVRRISEIKSSRIIVNIRSTGGDVNDALLIHDALKGLQADITTRCYGYTASAATIIAQAASPHQREISASALYLIHNSVCVTEGNAQEMEAKADLLRKTDRRIAEVYTQSGEHPVEEYEALMQENNGNGRWLSPDEVLEAGLADKLIDLESTAKEEEKTEETPTPEKAPAPETPTPEVPEKEAQEKKETALEKTSSPHNATFPFKRHIGKGWRRLVDTILDRPQKQEEPPKDRNIWHFTEDEVPLKRQSEVAFQASQSRITATEVASKEDPSLGDILHSSNEIAYNDDVACFKK